MAFKNDSGTPSGNNQTFDTGVFSPEQKAYSGDDPLGNVSWDHTLNDLTTAGSDITSDAITRLITELSPMIKEKYAVTMVAHSTSQQNFRIGWSGVAIIGKKVLENRLVSAGVFIYCADSVEAMAPRKVRIQELNMDSATFELPVHPINAWEDADAQDVIKNRMVSLSGDNNIKIASVFCLPKNYVINENTKENNINLIKMIAAAIINSIEKTAGRAAFPLRGGIVKKNGEVVKNDGNQFKLSYRINHGPDPVDIFGNPVRADFTLTLQRTPTDQKGGGVNKAFRTEQSILSLNGYTDYLYCGNENSQYNIGNSTIPPSFIPVPVITNIAQLQNNWSEFNVLALGLPLALFQNANFLQKWEPSATFDTMHNIGAMNIQGIRPGGANGVRVNTQHPDWNMGALQATFGGMIQPSGLICFDVNSFTINGGILELLLASTLANDIGAAAKNILIKEFDRATAGRFSNTWDVAKPMAQRMGVYPTGYWNFQEKQNDQVIQYSRDIRAVDYLAVCNQAANKVPVEARVPLEEINDWNSTRDPRRSPDFQMYGTLRSIERVLGPNFTSTGHIHRIAVQAALLRHLVSLVNSEFSINEYTYSGMNISLDAQRISSSGYSFDPGMFGQGLMASSNDNAFSASSFNGNNGGSNMFNFNSNNLSSFF